MIWIPYVAVGGAGLLGAITGLAYKKPAENKHLDYKEAIFESDLQLAETLYNEANSRYKTYHRLTRYGLGLAAATATVWSTHFTNYLKKNKHYKKYEKYCDNNNISFHFYPSEEVADEIILSLAITF